MKQDNLSYLGAIAYFIVVTASLTLGPLYKVYILHFGYTKFFVQYGLAQVSYQHAFILYIMLTLLNFNNQILLLDIREDVIKIKSILKNIGYKSNDDDSKIKRHITNMFCQYLVYTFIFLGMYFYN